MQRSKLAFLNCNLFLKLPTYLWSCNAHHPLTTKLPVYYHPVCNLRRVLHQVPLNNGHLNGGHSRQVGLRHSANGRTAQAQWPWTAASAQKLPARPPATTRPGWHLLKDVHWQHHWAISERQCEQLFSGAGGQYDAEQLLLQCTQLTDAQQQQHQQPTSENRSLWDGRVCLLREGFILVMTTSFANKKRTTFTADRRQRKSQFELKKIRVQQCYLKIHNTTH